MKVTFPYMGCVTGYKRLLELLGHEVIMPRKPTQRTVDLGVLHSPEFICYPFKIMMGTYVEACEDGAEVIISSGGSGPCRAGMYGDIHARILKGLGFNTEVIIFDSMFQDPKTFFKKLLMIKNKTPLWKVARHLLFAYKMICQMDSFEEQIKLLRPYEVNKNDFNKCWEKIVGLYDKCSTFKQLRSAKRLAAEMLKQVPIKMPRKETDKLRIGIVGEIYVIMESSTNMDIEQRLNDLGVEVVNVQYISHWLKHNMLPRAINRHESWKMYDKAEKYKSCNCGGHDMENTGHIVDFAEKGFDGVVHLMPFGCLPELVTRSMIPELSNKLDMPILSVSMDEQLGEANLQTRIEAFVELCKSRKKARYGETAKKQAKENSAEKALAGAVSD